MQQIDTASAPASPPATPDLCRKVRLSPAEWRHVKAQARLAGMSPSELLRKVAQGVYLEARPHALSDRLFHEIARLGNNLTQLRRIAEEVGQSGSESDLRAASKAISDWLLSPPDGRVSDALSGARRPPLIEAVLPRLSRGFRISRSDWEGFCDEAQAVEMPPSRYLRERALRLDLTAPQSVVRRATLDRLIDLGREVNGFARHANENGFVLDPAGLKATLERLGGWLLETQETQGGEENDRS